MYGGVAEFDSNDHGDLMYETLTTVVTKEVAAAIREANSVSITAGSDDFAVKVDLDDEMIDAFSDLVDRAVSSSQREAGGTSSAAAQSEFNCSPQHSDPTNSNGTGTQGGASTEYEEPAYAK